jgi:hypothetical protein
LFTPLILSFSTPEVLGSVISVGALAAGRQFVDERVGRSRRKVDSLMGSMFVFGLFLSLVGLRPNPILIGVANLAFMFLLGIARSLVLYPDPPCNGPVT